VKSLEDELADYTSVEAVRYALEVNGGSSRNRE
jgi:hypothetical protein